MAQAYVNVAFNVSSAYGMWNRWNGFDYLRIERSVMDSVYLFCEQGADADKMKTITVVVLVFLSMGSSNCAHIGRRPRAPRDSLCVVVSDLATYAGREVALKALIKSDGIEHVMLFDEHCPGIGLSIDETSEGPVDASVTAVLVKVFRSAMQKDDAEIRGTFRGRIVHRPGEVPGVALALRIVDDVTVSTPSR